MKGLLMSSKYCFKLRSSAGNILTLYMVIGFVVLVLALWAIDLFWLHFLSGKEMSAAEKVAMAAAVALNKDDSIGQMNYILAHSRELILVSRRDLSSAEDDHKSFLPLAQSLAQKAHDMALQLEAERSNLESQRINEALAAAQNAVASAGSPAAAHMANVATSGVTINFEQSFFGCAKKAPSESDLEDFVSTSNVEPTKYYFGEKNIDKMLLEYDKKFIDQSANFYKGNTVLDLNLPGGGYDSDLQFPLSSLPPCINNYVSPPRLIQPSEFHKMAPLKAGALPKFIPNAVYVVLQLDVKDNQTGASNKLMAPGVAVASGAGAPP